MFTLQAELMDQDLSLMEQLLTLNDNIEEMKHKYMYSVSKDSLGASSCNLSAYYDYTDSEMSLASLDINDYNEDSLFGSEIDIRGKGTKDNDEVFVEGSVGLDDAFKRWVKKQMSDSDKESDCESGLTEETQKVCHRTEKVNSLTIPQGQEKHPRCQSEGFVVSGQSEIDNFNDDSKTQSREESLEIASSVTDVASENSNGCSENHEPKEELPDIKLDGFTVRSHEAKHLTSSFKSNISTDSANISYDSDDNINIEDFDDSVLNV